MTLKDAMSTALMVLLVVVLLVGMGVVIYTLWPVLIQVAGALVLIFLVFGALTLFIWAVSNLYNHLRG